MSFKVYTWFLVIALMCNAVLTEDAKEQSREHDIKIHDWFVSFDEAAFSDNTGFQPQSVLPEADAYKKVFTLFSPRFTVGYLITPKWSFEAQLQLGPKESIDFFKDGDKLYPSSSVGSRFMSVSMSRSISLRRGYEFEGKVGVVNALFESRIKYPDSQLKLSVSETKPMASIGIRKTVTPRISAGMDFTRYFLSKSGSVTTGTIGLRYSF